MRLNPKLLAYLQGLVVAMVVIGPFAVVQNVFVVGEFEARYIVIPAIVALVLGALIGTVLALRRDLETQRSLFKAVADFALEFSYVQDLDGSFRYVSPAVKRLTGYAAETLKRDPELLDRMIHPEDRELWAEHRAHLHETREPQVIEMRIIAADGEVHWVRHYAGPVKNDEGRVVSIRATTIDVTRQKDYENYVRMLADYDPLTELPNRRFLHRELDAVVREAQARQEGFAVIFMDLDRFKYINDAHGHSVGDLLLMKLAQRLST